MDYKIDHFQKIIDGRGQLVVFLKKTDLATNSRIFGQIYFVTFEEKGVVRGNHYHKNWREWFGVVSGKLKVVLKDMKTGEVRRLILDGDSEEYIRLEVGPNIAHAVQSISQKASLLNYCNTQWSEDDTCYFELIKNDGKKSSGKNQQ